jgi:hypothetical protein
LVQRHVGQKNVAVNINRDSVRHVKPIPNEFFSLSSVISGGNFSQISAPLVHDFSRVGVVRDEGVGLNWALVNFEIVVGGVEGRGVPLVVATLE